MSLNLLTTWTAGFLCAAIGGPAVEGPEVPVACAVTTPNGVGITGEPDAPYYYGNGTLATSFAPDGRVVFKPGGPGCVHRDGSLWMKWPWWRGVRGPVTVEGRRLDGTSRPLRAWVPSRGYRDIGFTPSAMIFPEPGCWEVTARVGEASLTFVTRVEKIGEGPASPCRSLFPAAFAGQP